MDWVVMVYHGGAEFTPLPMPYTRKRLRRYLRWGCDAVVAHHPHVVQGYEQIGDKYIFYSLGNFVFDTDFQRAQPGTDRGVLLRLDFGKDGMRFVGHPTRIDRQRQRVVTAGADDAFGPIDPRMYRKNWPAACMTQNPKPHGQAQPAQPAAKQAGVLRRLYRKLKRAATDELYRTRIIARIRLYFSSNK